MVDDYLTDIMNLAEKLLLTTNISNGITICHSSITRDFL